MAASASRLTLYAIFSSIEQDARKAVVSHLDGTRPNKDLLAGDLFSKCMERIQSDVGIAGPGASLAELLNYADFGDLFHILNREKEQLPEALRQTLKQLNPKIEALAPVRNRVAHSRPILFDDLPITFDLARELVRSDENTWSGLRDTLDRLNTDPSFVLGLNIPELTNDPASRKHNLPTPDFDETGFIGREALVKHVSSVLLGAYPVVTLVGDGGVGKTALALKVAYDVLDLKERPFDAIVWTTSKTSRITESDIVAIDGAIKDSLGVFKSMAQQLAGDTNEEVMHEVLTYLKEFRILLIMDNLETVLDERVRSFLGQLPAGSKVLVTSRIGLGAYEFPVKLESMAEGEAVQLLRAVSRVRGVPELGTMPNPQLAKYCLKMNNNPGFIKWFVAAVRSGKRPEEVFAKPHLFLDFCMSNVYQYLSESSRRTLMAMQCLPGRHSQAELGYLLEVDDPVHLQRSLQQLLTTNMVRMVSMPTGASFESRYEIAEMARDYLTNHHPLKPEDVKRFSKRKGQIRAAGDKLKSGMTADRYRPRNLRMRSASDTIVAKYLGEALQLTAENKLNEASRCVGKAKELAPEYFEVHRVDAFVRVKANDISGANTAYRAAIELEPTWPPLRLWYGGFLLRYLDDLTAGKEQFMAGLKQDPQSAELKIELARAELYLKEYKEVDKQLSSLLDEHSPNLSVRLKKKAYDLYLQTRFRWAEELEIERDAYGAHRLLQELRVAYEQCPRNLRDYTMIEHMANACKTAVRLCQALRHEPTEYHKASELARWLVRTTGHTGKVFDIAPTQATVELPDKRQLVIPRGSFVVAEEWRALKVGALLIFNLVRSNTKEYAAYVFVDTK